MRRTVKNCVVPRQLRPPIRRLRWVAASFGLAVCLLLSLPLQASAQQSEARIEHLLLAATHLEQAGLVEQAAEIRGLLVEYDEQLKRKMLDEKLARLRQLQAEVDQLQQALDSLDQRPEITLRLKVLELSLEKLNRAGFGLVSFRQLLDADSPATVVETEGDVLQFLEMLQLHGFAEVLATPTLVTRDGRSASLEIDPSESPSAARHGSDTGAAGVRREPLDRVRVRLTPHLGESGALELELGFDCGSASEHGLPPAAGSSAESQEAVQAKVKMSTNQTLVLAHQTSARETDPSMATLLLVEYGIPKSPR